MIEKVIESIEKDRLIMPGDCVLAGVSGGADSVCLLLILLELRQRLDFTLEVVHVEHGIRGEDSRRDAVFVEELCRQRGLAFHMRAVDVPAYASGGKIGLEEAARQLRYESYREVAEKLGRPRVRVALAHHAEDNAETMLFWLARGSGVAGLGGIRAKRRLSEHVAIIRPLLSVSRAQIEAYLREHGQEYRVDATNADTDYSRNKIRFEVLPKLAEINPQAVSHMQQSAKILQETADYMEAEAKRVMERTCVWKEDTCRIAEELFFEYPHIIQAESVHRVLARAAGSGKDIGRVHVEAVLGLARSQAGRRVNLPYRLCAERVYGGITLCRAEAASRNETGRACPKEGTGGDRSLCEKPVEITKEELAEAASGGMFEVVLSDGRMCFRILDFSGKTEEIPKKKYTKWLNYDKIKNRLQVRKRMEGDYLTIDRQGHHKKLKAYFIGEKFPAKQRDDIWLLTEGAEVLWVVGGRISEDYRIEEQTERVLEVRIIGGRYCED